MAFLICSGPLHSFYNFAGIPSTSGVAHFGRSFLSSLRLIFSGLISVARPVYRTISSTGTSVAVFSSSNVRTFIARGGPGCTGHVVERLGTCTGTGDFSGGCSPCGTTCNSVPSRTSTGPRVGRLCVGKRFYCIFGFNVVAGNLKVVERVTFCGGGFVTSRPSVAIRGGSSSPSRSGSIRSSELLVPALGSFFLGRPLVGPGAFLNSTTFSATTLCPGLLANGAFKSRGRFSGTCVPLGSETNLRGRSCAVGRGKVPYYPRSSSLPVGCRKVSGLEDNIAECGFIYPGVG